MEEVHYVNDEHVPLMTSVSAFSQHPGRRNACFNVLENGQPIAPDYQLNNSLMIAPLTQPLSQARA
jgi:hypothetical protein